MGGKHPLMCHSILRWCTYVLPACDKSEAFSLSISHSLSHPPSLVRVPDRSRLEFRKLEETSKVDREAHLEAATKSGRAGCASDRRRQPGQQLDQSVGEASNRSTEVEREGRLEAGSRSAAWRYGALTLCRCRARKAERRGRSRRR
jgi:hypothetical protein